MKYVMIMVVLVGLNGCAANKLQQKRDKTLECTKELIDLESGTEVAYKVCTDLYKRKEQ
jgi:hypothetical protein